MGAPEAAVNEPPPVMLNVGRITTYSFARNTLTEWVMSAPERYAVPVQEQGLEVEGGR